ncbi:MAG: hypothetical protein M3331_05630 [Actinomycetota bacterium]|nr:hypothetical protein [Actinomycetota bacterium]
MSAWRSRGDSVEVITFWAVGNYRSGLLRVEPHSFQIQLGVWLDYARPSIVLGPDADNIPNPGHPHEAACPIRRTLDSRRPAAPDPSRPRFSGVEPIWSLSRDPAEVEGAIALALDALQEEAQPWFERFADPREVLRTLRDDPQDMSGTWGFGNPDSPSRIELVEATEAYLAT